MIRGSKDELAHEVARQGDDDPLRQLLEEVCRTTRMGFAAVARVTDRRWIACQVVDQIEFGLDPGDELDIKTTICDDIRRSGAAVVIDHVGNDSNWRTHPVPILYGFQSYASFPVFLPDGSFYGTLCAIDPAPNIVSDPATVDAMRAYAARAGSILQTAPGTLD